MSQHEIAFCVDPLCAKKSSKKYKKLPIYNNWYFERHMTSIFLYPKYLKENERQRRRGT
jgi:hypothetical protein